MGRVEALTRRIGMSRRSWSGCGHFRRYLQAHFPQVEGDRTIFSFAEDYIADEGRPTLGLSFKDELGALISTLPATRKRLLPFFSNVLPEGHSRQYLAEQAGVNPEREFFQPGALGDDLPGAPTASPVDGEAWPPGRDQAVSQAERERRENAPRFSLAGVQLNFSAVHDESTSKGLTIPAKGVGGPWIVKLPSARFEGVPENEFAMMTLARLVGINVPEFMLIDLDGIEGLPEGIGDPRGQASVCSRFYRTPDGPVYMEDIAEGFRVCPERKYASASYRNVATVLAAETGEAGTDEFIRRLVFSELIGNADPHLENWSLVYPDRRTPALSPAYDLVATIPYIDDGEAAMKLARTRRFADFRLDELSYLAGKAGLGQTLALETAKETVARFHDAWRAEKAHLPQGPHVTEKIDEHLESLPIASI